MGNSSQEPEKAKEPNPATIAILYSALDNYGGYPFVDMFDGYIPAYHPTDLLTSNGVLVVWGGADISPSMYGQTPGSRTQAGKELSSKDQLEINLIGAAIKSGMPILGICRGAQMLCAAAGGKLIQHVSGHHDTHQIKTDKGKLLKATSLHHQMLFPWHTNHKLVAWAHPPLSKEYLGQGGKDEHGEEYDELIVFPEEVDPEKREPEVVYFPEIKALAIQGHPEFVRNEKHEFVVYCRDLVEEYLLKPFVKRSTND